MLTLVACATLLHSTFAYDFKWIGLDAGGWVTGMSVHPASRTVYARTDVGGAYTSSDGGKSWNWISGYIPGTGAWGTQCLAPDPSDSSGNTILIGHGNIHDDSSKEPWSKQGISRSTDGGKTWELVLPNITFSANADWRQGGECIAFDPASPSIVWAGSQDGLYRSDKAGAAGSWAPVDSFNSNPRVFNATTGGLAGISFRGTLEQPHLGAYSHADARRKHPGLGSASQEVWVVGPQHVAISLDGGSSWKPAADFGNASALGVAGGLRARRCLNGTTFVSVFSSSSTAAELEKGVEEQGAQAGKLKSKGLPDLLARVEASDWSDPSTYRWTAISGTREKDGSQGLPKGSGSVDLIEVLYGESTLVSAYAEGSFGVSRDGGQTFSMKNRTQLRGPGQLPVWFPKDPAVRNTIAFGNGRLIIDPTDSSATRWVMGTGFYPASTTDEGDNWAADFKGFGEVVTYRAQQHPYIEGRTFVGVMDLAAFMLDGDDVAWAMMGHEPERPPWNQSWFVIDYCHSAAFWPAAQGSDAPGTMRMACNKQGAGEGQWLESTDGGLSWTVTLSADLAGIEQDVPFVDLLQSPDDPDDLLMTTGWGWYSNSSTSAGMWRSTNGGKSWKKALREPKMGYIGSFYSPAGHISADPVDKDTRYWSLDNAGIFVSKDRGVTWDKCPMQPFRDGVFNSGLAAAEDPTGGFGGKPGGSVLMAAGQTSEIGAGLQISFDGCQTWSTVPGSNMTWKYPMGGSGGPNLDVHPSGVVVTTMAKGQDWQDSFSVWASTDFGKTWTDIADVSKGQGVRATGLYIDRWNPKRVVLSTGGRSLASVVLD